MGLGDFWRNGKALITGARVITRLKEENKVGKLWAALYGLASCIAVAVTAKVSGACPDLLQVAGALALITGVAGGLSLWAKKRSAGEALAGGGGFVGLVHLAWDGIREQVVLLCGPDFFQLLPSLIVAGFMVGLGLYLASPKGVPGAPAPGPEKG